MDAWLVDDEWWMHGLTMAPSTVVSSVQNEGLKPSDRAGAWMHQEVMATSREVGEGRAQDDRQYQDDEQDEEDAQSSGNPREKKAKRGRPKKAGSKAVRNAEACRKHREKRKREEERLRKRNEELEAEREIYLTRIADLQSEVQGLRCAGTVDLQKENELIRSEIRKYKSFVNNLIQATMEIPNYSPEEKFWRLKSGAESGLSQLIGLLYASVSNDPSWVHAPSFFHEDKEIKLMFQLLPMNAKTAGDIKRINYRVMYDDIPHHPEVLCDKVWSVMTSPGVLERVYNELNSQSTTVKRKAVDIFPDDLKLIRDRLNTKLTMFKFTTPTSDKMVEHIATAFGKQTDLHPMVFSMSGNYDLQNPEMIPSFCASYSTAVAEIASSETTGERSGTISAESHVTGAHFYSDIIAQNNKGGSLVTILVSVPVADLETSTRFSSEEIAMFFEGKVPPNLQNELKNHRRMMQSCFIDYCKE